MFWRSEGVLIGLTTFLLAFFSWALIHIGAPAQTKAAESLTLSITASPPDADNFPPAPPAQTSNQSSAIVAPWQGPAAPIVLNPSPGAPEFSRLPVSEPVVFVGIDDGWYQSPENLAWLKVHHLPFSLFLVDSQIRGNYDYFHQLQNAGMTIEDHSATHPDFTKLKLEDQQAQICSTADSYQTVFGRRPAFFRPPYGDYNSDTQTAAATCGMKALINWRVVLDNGVIQYQPPATHLEAGDIILVHFQSDLIPNMQALNAELEKDHLQVARLEDWLR